MSLYDAILINGTVIPDGLPPEVRAGCCVEGPWEWPYIGASQRGEFPVFAGFDGAGYIAQPYQVNVLPFYITLSSPPCSGDTVTQSNETFAWLNHAFETIRTVCKPDQPSTLTRRRSLSPYATDQSQTAAAKLLNITPARPGRDTLKLVVEFSLLDGLWYDSPEVETVSTSTYINVLGDTRTNNIVIRFPGVSSDSTITNETNGYSVNFQGNTPAGGVDVDVLARTATTVIGGIDLSRYLLWPKAHPFRLDPGVNHIVVDSHTAAGTTVTYNPAYL